MICAAPISDVLRRARDQLAYYGPLPLAALAYQRALGMHASVDMVVHISCAPADLLARTDRERAWTMHVVTPSNRADYAAALQWRRLDLNLQRRPADTHLVLAYARDAAREQPVGYRFFRYPPRPDGALHSTGTLVDPAYRGHQLCAHLVHAVSDFVVAQGHPPPTMLGHTWWLNHPSRRAHARVGYRVRSRQLTARLGPFVRSVHIRPRPGSRWQALA